MPRNMPSWLQFCIRSHTPATLRNTYACVQLLCLALLCRMPVSLIINRCVRRWTTGLSCYTLHLQLKHHTVSQKGWRWIFAVTLTNFNRFSKFFHYVIFCISQGHVAIVQEIFMLKFGKVIALQRHLLDTLYNRLNEIRHDVATAWKETVDFIVPFDTLQAVFPSNHLTVN